MQDLSPASRGGAMDARQITFLETVFGQSLANPDSNAATQWRMSWHQVREYYGASLLAQTTLKPLFDQIQYTWDDASQTLKADLSGVETLLQDGLAADAANGTTTGTAQLADFARAIKGLGAQDSVNYLALRETFVELDQLNGTDLAWAMDSAGLPVYDTLHTGQRAWSPHMEGTDGSEAVRGSLVEGDGYINSLYGHDTLWGTQRNEHLINEAGNSLLYGAGGGDTLNAGDGDDTLDGGTGNDTLMGEAGNDTYVFRKGSGVDQIYTWNAGDRVWLAANADEVTVKRSRNDLVIGFIDTPDKLIVKNYQSVAQSGAVIGFRDGSTWDDAGIAAGAGPGNDLLIGSASADTLPGLAGNDQIAGNAGNDLIDGGSGNDTLIGAADYSAYADLLAPATRGNGDDSYLFRRGDGNDTIADLDPTANTDTLRLIGIAPEELSLRIANERSGWDGRTATTLADIVIDLGQGESITLQGALNRSGAATGKIERIEFAASADAEPTLIWTEPDLRAKLLAGSAADNDIQGWGDADRIDGGAGNESRRWQDGGPVDIRFAANDDAFEVRRTA
ncbi:MAG: hypothetical protein IPL72_00845 [Sulfuritalea sp.]|nr:hypothetical protein [Sulfuritalea sp.]